MSDHDLFDSELAGRLRGLAPEVHGDDAFASMLPRFEQAKRRRRAGIASVAVAAAGSVALVALFVAGGPSLTQGVRTNPATGGSRSDSSNASRSTSGTDGNHDFGGIPGVDPTVRSGKSGSDSGSSSTGTGAANSGSKSGSGSTGGTGTGSGSNSGPGTGSGGSSGTGGGSSGPGDGGTGTTTPTSPPPTAAFDRTYTALGGKLTVHVDGTNITIVSFAPADASWTAKRNDHGANDVEIDFETADHQQSSIRVRFNDNGDLEATIKP